MTQVNATQSEDPAAESSDGHFCVHIHEQSQDGVSDDENLTIGGHVPKFIKILVPAAWGFDTVDNVLLITSESRQTTKIVFCNYPRIRIVKGNRDKGIETPPKTPGRDISGRLQEVPTEHGRECPPAESVHHTDSAPSARHRLKGLSWEKPVIFKYSSAERGERQLLLYQFPPIEYVLDGRSTGSRWEGFVRGLLARAVTKQDDPIFLVMDPRTVTRRQEVVCQTRMLSANVQENVLEDQERRPKRGPRIVRPATAETGDKGKAEEKRNAGQKAQRASSRNKKGTSTHPGVQSHPRESRTAIKCLSPTKLLSREFRRFFRLYSSLGSPLNSGAAITRWNSNFWLETAGVVKDAEAGRLASTLFLAVAGNRVVLGIYDYLRFLMLLARQKKMILAEMVKQMIQEGHRHLEFKRKTQTACKTPKSTLEIKKEPQQKARRSSSMPILTRQLAIINETDNGENKNQTKQAKSQGWSQTP